MRSHPSCWNKTLTKLGFKRKRRKKGRRPDFMNRRSLFEQLEVRAMLSASTGMEEDVTDDTVVVGSLVPPAVTKVEFSIVGGDSKNLFSVSTSYDSLGKPMAHISLNTGMDIAERVWHEIELEMHLDLLSISRHRVQVMLAGDEIVQDIRDYRVSEAQANAGKELDWTDSSIELSTDLENVLDVSKQISSDQLSLSSKSDTLQLYGDVLAATDFVGRTDGSANTKQREAEQKELGYAAALLAEQIKSDLQSSDAEVVAAAQAARDQIVATAKFGDLAYLGYGLNSSVKQIKENGANDLRYSAIYEAGQLQMGDYVVVDLGQAGLAEVIETPLNSGSWTPSWAAALGSGLPGTDLKTYSEADYSITYDYDTGTPGTQDVGGTYLTVSNQETPDFESDGLFRFDISQHTQYVENATVTLHPVWKLPVTAPDSSLDQQALFIANDDWSETTPTSWSGIEDREESEVIEVIGATGNEQTWRVNADQSGYWAPVVLDVTDEVRYKLRRGDMNFDGERGDANYGNQAFIDTVTADIAAFAVALEGGDLAAYKAEYSQYSDDQDILDRGDFDGSGTVNAGDLDAFLRSHGLLQGDIGSNPNDGSGGLDGRIDAIDSGTLFQNWQGPGNYGQGNVNLSSLIDAADAGILFSNWDTDGYEQGAVADKISIRIYVPDQGPVHYGEVYYGTNESGVDYYNTGGSEVDVRPTLDVEEPAFIVNSLADWSDLNPGDGIVDASTDPGRQVTLRAALEEAEALSHIDRVIGFHESLYGQSIVLSQGELEINSNVTIVGPGADLLTIDAAGLGNPRRVISVEAGVTASISGLTITGGYLLSGQGGGIHNSGDLTLDAMVVTNNQAFGDGGGLYSASGSISIVNTTFDSNSAGLIGGGAQIDTDSGGTVFISGSTFSGNIGNSAGGGLSVTGGAGSSSDGAVGIVNSTFSSNRGFNLGGGLYFQEQDAATIVNSTVTLNDVFDGDGDVGGGIYVDSASSVTVQNSIVAGNILIDGANADIEVEGTLAGASDFNLYGEYETTQPGTNNVLLSGPDTGLMSLDYYGGLTQTHALESDSPALDAGDNTLAENPLTLDPLETDQRGESYLRKVDDTNENTGTIDIGAFERPWLELSTGQYSPNAEAEYTVGNGAQDVFDETAIFGTVDSLVVTITDRQDGAAEVLTADTTGTSVTASYAFGVLTLTGGATSLEFQQVLDSVQYNNSAFSPTPTPRTIQVDLVQGDLAVASATATLTLKAQGAIVLNATQDISHNGTDPADPDAEELDVDDPLATVPYVTYLQFEIPSSVTTADYVSLSLYTTEFESLPNHEQQTLHIYLMNDNWDETTPPDDFASEINMATEDTIGHFVARVGQYGTVDLTDAFVAELSGDNLFSLAIVDGNPNDDVWTKLASSEYADPRFRPKLSISGAFENEAPIANSDVFDTHQSVYRFDSSTQGSVLDNDDDPDSNVALTAELVSDPIAGRLRFSADGNFYYTPDQEADYSSVEFYYRAFDGLAYSEPARVTINIEPTTTIEYDIVSDQMVLFGDEKVFQTPLLTQPFPAGLVPETEHVGCYLSTDPSNHIHCDGLGVPELQDYSFSSYVKLNLSDFETKWETIINDVVSVRLQLYESEHNLSYFGNFLPDYLARFRESVLGADIFYSPWRDPVLLYLREFEAELINNIEEAEDGGLIFNGVGNNQEASFRSYEFTGVSDAWTSSITPGSNPPYLVSVEEDTYESVPEEILGVQYDSTHGWFREVELLPLIEEALEANDINKEIAIRINGLTDESRGFRKDPKVFVSFKRSPGLANYPGNVSLDANSAPYFTSEHLNEVHVGETFQYTMTASDADNDELQFQVPPLNIQFPAGFVPQAEDFPTLIQNTDVNGDPLPSAEFTWTPPPELVGHTVTFTEVVTDEAGHVDFRTFDVFVDHASENQPPVIIADPAGSFVLTEAIPDEEVQYISPNSINLQLAEGQIAHEEISLTLQEPLRSEMVFVLDSTASMNFGFQWFANAIESIDDALQLKGFEERVYGVTTFQKLNNYDNDVGPHKPFGATSYWMNETELATVVGGLMADDLADGEFGYHALADVLGINQTAAANVYDFNSSGADPKLTSRQIVLITDENLDGFLDVETDEDPENEIPDEQERKESVRGEILNALEGNPDDSFDDIVLTTIVNARHAGRGTGDRPPGFEEVDGDWSMGDYAYHATAASETDWAISVLDAHMGSIYLAYAYGDGHEKTLDAGLQIDEAGGNALLIFDYQEDGLGDPEAFKFVMASAADNHWHIGQWDDTNGFDYVFSSQAPSGIRAGQEYQVRVALGHADFEDGDDYATVEGPIAVNIDGVEIVSNLFFNDYGLFEGDFADGRIGFATYGSSASFAGISLSNAENPVIPKLERDNIVYSFGKNGIHFPVLGYTAQDVAYFAEHTPSNADAEDTFSRGKYLFTAYSFHQNTAHLDSDDTYDDYITLGLETGGSTWDQSLLRDVFSDPFASSSNLRAFSNAFADAVAAQTALNTEPISIAVVNDVFSGVTFEANPDGLGMGTDIEASYVATFEGDGASHNFMLEFFRLEDDPNVAGYDPMPKSMGEIPVRITAPYVVDFYAQDPDGPTPLTFEIVSGPEDHGAMLVSTDPEGTLVNDRLIWDAEAWYADTGQTGEQTVTFEVTVSDGYNQYALENFSWDVTVKPPEPNTQPVIDGVSPSDVGPFDPPAAQVGVGYLLKVLAHDDDGDRLRYILEDDAPSGMFIDRNTGEIRWVPTSDDDVTFNVRVSDGRLKVLHDTPQQGEFTIELGEATQEITITVNEREFANIRPTIDPIPSKTIHVGASFVHQAEGHDFNGDDLTYVLLGEPDGMDIHEKTGIITWSPQKQDIGSEHTITVKVADGRGKENSTSFQLFVLSDNHAPVFRSTPNSAGIDLNFEYRLETHDEDGDQVTYFLKKSPEDMHLEDRIDGWYVVWEAKDMTVGSHPVEIVADDGNRGFDTQAFSLDVLSVAVPIFLGEPRKRAPDGTAYEFEFGLRTGRPLDDINTDLVLDSLSAALGMTIDISDIDITSGGQSDPYIYSGLKLKWDVPIAGAYSIAITATNDAGASSTFEYDLEILPAVATEDNRGPEFRTESLGPFAVGKIYDFTLDIVDAEGHAIDEVNVLPATTAPGFDENNVSDDGRIKWTPDKAGDYQIVLEAIDELGAVTEVTYEVHVAPNASPTIKAGLVDPAFVDQPFYYTVTIEDPNPNDTLMVTLNDEAHEYGMHLVRSFHDPTQWTLEWEEPGPVGTIVPVRIAAHDGRLLVAANFNLEVFEPGDVLPLPPSGDIEIPMGREFQYRLITNPPAGVVPEYEVDVPGGTVPEGITVSADGVLSWTPTYADAGGEANPSATHSLEITIDYNPTTAIDNQTVELDITVVKPEDFVATPPVIDPGTLPKNAKAARQLFYQPTADGGVEQLEWILDKGPEGMDVDVDSGELTWRPDSTAIGESYDIVLRVQDGLDQSDVLSFRLDVVGAGPAPVLNTAFPRVWQESEDFEFQVLASHPLGQELRYELFDLNGTPLASGQWEIDPASGILSWDNPDAGDYPFILQVSEKMDPESNVRKTIHIGVGDTSEVPSIEAVLQDTPAGRKASVGKEFKHVLSVWDPDQQGGVNFAYDIVGGELGDMAVNNTTNEFTWTPTIDDVDIHTITIEVTDDSSNKSYATFNLEVVDNDAPVITSPVLTPTVGTLLVYQVAARDPDGDTLIYEIDDAPAGLTINRDTGVLRWEVPDTVPGTTPEFDLIVTDENGLIATESDIEINVQPDNIAPTISFHIEDADGNVVLPRDTIDSNSATDYTLWFTIEDNLGQGEDEVHWVLEAFDTAGLNIEGHMAVETLSDTRGGTFSAAFTDELNSGLLYVRITAGDTDFVNPNDNPTLVSGNVATQTFRYNTVNSTQAAHAQLVNVDSQDGVLLIDERFDVRGIAHYEIDDDPLTYAGYDLKLVSVDDPNDFVYLVRNRTANIATSGVLGTIDPTLVKSGQYRLYLEVRTTQAESQDIAGIDEQIVEIRNDARLGNLDFSFTDLSVDLGGIPVSLVRSYSSALVGIDDAGIFGDFGPGWTLNFLQAGIEIAHHNQVTSSLNEPFADDTRVLVELPDGSVHRFEFEVRSLGSSSGGPYRPFFRADPDTYSTLELAGLEDSLLLIPNAGRGDGTYVSANTNQAFMPSTFGSALVLTTQSGLKYLFDVNTGGLTAIEDENGRQVTVTHDESTSETTIGAENTTDGTTESIVIHFDNEGRIDWIKDPIVEDVSDQIIEYFYGDYDSGNVSQDSLMNLAQVTNRVGDSVYYDYTNDHYERHLTEIYDNTHVNVLLANYFDPDDTTADPTITADQHGRLQDLDDASGQGADLAFDIGLGDGRMVTRVDDGNGIQVDEVTDNRGNVLRRVQLIDDQGDGPGSNDEFLVTKFEYNTRGLLTHQSVPYIVVGLSNRYKDELNDPVSNPEAPGYERSDWAQIVTYDQKDRTKTVSDALGNTTTFVYDDADRVVETIDPNGVSTHNVYDRYTGNLLETYVTQGESGQRLNHSRFEYDGFGRVTKTYQVDGSNGIEISETRYNSAGRVDWTEDAAGLKRYFGYDENGNQTHSWYNWDDEGSNYIAVVSETEFDSEGRVTNTREYEVLGGPYNEFLFTTLKDKLEDEATDSDVTLLWTTTTEYDDQGRVEWSEDRYGARTYTIYNITGNVIESRTEVQDENDVEGWLISRTLYDAQGRVEFSADPYFVTKTDYTNDVNFDNTNLYGTRTIYDTLGRVERTERHSGVELNLVTNAGGDMAVELDAAEVWDEDGAVSPTTVRLSESKTFYDDLGRVEYTESETGARTDYYYDATGRQIATLGPTVDVLENGTVVEHRVITISTFDAAGRLLRSATAIKLTGTSDLHPAIFDESTQQFDETLLDRSAQQTTFYEYSTAGRQTAVITTEIDDPNSAERTHIRSETVYDGFGRRTDVITGLTQTDPLDSSTIDRTYERITKYEYDNSGNLTAVNLPEVELADDFEDPGNPATVRPRYEYQYDAFGNRTTVTTNAYLNEATGRVVYLRKDAAGDDTKTHGRDWGSSSPPADDDGTTTVYTFDHYNRQTSRQLPEGVAAANETFKELMVYDDRALVAVSGSLAESTALGQLKYSVDFEGRVTAYFYDNTEEGGGRLVKKAYFTDETTYNGGAGNPTDTVTYSYDEFGRTTEVDQDFNLTGTPTERITTNTYNDEGQLISVATNEATIHYEYAIATGLLIRTYTTDGVGSNERTDVRNVYDDLGRLTHVIAVELVDLSAGTTSATWYDEDGVATPLTNVDVTEYFYDLVGNQARVKLDNGLVTDYEYDELNRLTRMVNYIDGNGDGAFDKDANGDFDLASTDDVLRGSYEYEVDLFHKRTAATEIINTAATDNSEPVTSEIDWVYDNLGRLTREDYNYDTTSGTQAHDFVTDYTFDLVGNRLTKEVDETRDSVVDEVFAYHYDDNDRMIRERLDDDPAATDGYEKTTFYQYDDNDATDGDLMDGTTQTSKTVYSGDLTAPSGAKLSETTFEYNLQGRMKKATIDEDGDASGVAKVTTYEYGDGTRISQTVDGTTTLYVVDKNNATGYSQILEEGIDDDTDGMLDDGEIDKSYIIGHDVIAQALEEAGNLAIQYLMYDGHGSTRALLDELAAVEQDASSNDQLFAYDAYGNLIAGPGLVALAKDALTSFLFSGEQALASIGRYNNRARIYDTVTGTFNRTDPYAGDIFDPQSLHKRLYTHADPINGIDPNGMALVDLIGAYATGLEFAAEAVNQGYDPAKAFRFGFVNDLVIAGTFGVFASAVGGVFGEFASAARRIARRSTDFVRTTVKTWGRHFETLATGRYAGKVAGGRLVGRIGKFTIQAGAKLDADEVAVGRAFALHGYDVLGLEQASLRGIQSVRTSDLDVAGIGRVDVLTPRAINSTALSRHIEQKGTQAPVVAVRGSIPVAVQHSAAIRLWGKTSNRAKAVQQIVFEDNGVLSFFTRPR